MPTFAFVGSFVMPNPPEHEGLHVFHVDPDTGSLTSVAVYVPGLNVGSFAFDSKRRVLYVTDEVSSTAEFRGKHGCAGGGGGQVYAFSVGDKGELVELGHWPSFGTQPAGIALDRGFLVVSHFTGRATTTVVTGDRARGFNIEPRYDDTTTVLFPIGDDGGLQPPCDVHHHATISTPSCIHSATLSPDGTFFVECDMSKDQILSMSVDHNERSLEVRNVHNTPTHSGPRYSAFHPCLPVFYVNFEYGAAIEVFNYSPGGSFTSRQTVRVLPDELDTGSTVLLSDLRVHPSGRWVYTLARGHNVVSVFAVNSSGNLKRIQTEPLDALSPKGCAVSSNGRYLYVAVSVSNQVQVWAIGADGRISKTSSVKALRPSAILLVDL